MKNCLICKETINFILITFECGIQREHYYCTDCFKSWYSFKTPNCIICMKNEIINICDLDLNVLYTQHISISLDTLFNQIEICRKNILLRQKEKIELLLYKYKDDSILKEVLESLYLDKENNTNNQILIKKQNELINSLDEKIQLQQYTITEYNELIISIEIKYNKLKEFIIKIKDILEKKELLIKQKNENIDNLTKIIDTFKNNQIIKEFGPLNNKV